VHTDEATVEADAGGTAKGIATVQELSRGERSSVRRVAEARATVPDVELGAIVDVSAWPARLGADAGRLFALPTAALVRASALALKTVPRANGAYRDGRFELYSRVNVGVAMPAADGYATPTVFDADGKTVAEIEAELSDLSARALAGELSAPELAGATFTLANLGMDGVSRGTIIPVPPQAAALAAGAARATMIVRDGAAMAGYELELTLASDHRILHGSHAASFLNAIVTLLEDPETL
jgi:pyruvate dehydrogenase E2 component (dihydrolipoamide acetyltransferase)